MTLNLSGNLPGKSTSLSSFPEILWRLWRPVSMRTPADRQGKGQTWLNGAAATELTWDTRRQRGASAGKAQTHSENECLCFCPCQVSFGAPPLPWSWKHGWGIAGVGRGLTWGWAAAVPWDAQGSVRQQWQLLHFLRVEHVLGVRFLSIWCPVNETTAEKFRALWKGKYLGFYFFPFFMGMAICL